MLLVLTLWLGTACGDGNDAEGSAQRSTPSSSDATPPATGGTPTPSETSSSSPGSTRPDVAVTGTWGGDHVALVLHGSGGVVEFDCAQGEIAESVLTDATGKFVAAGTYLPDPGGPAQMGDEEPTGVRAQYVGRIDNSRMSLTVVLPDHGTRHGPFRLVHGDSGTPESCL